MVASWPPTSGATRISVVRTTPTMGAACSSCHRTYPPAPAAARRRPSTVMTAALRLAIRLPPLAQKRRAHREREISGGEETEPPPVVHHLTQARARSID